MNSIQNILRCYCVGDKRTACVYKNSATGECRCPCHFSKAEHEKLAAFYLRDFPGGASKGAATPPDSKTPASVTVEYQCGHGFVPAQKLSSMSLQYVKTHDCETCREVRA